MQQVDQNILIIIKEYAASSARDSSAGCRQVVLVSMLVETKHSTAVSLPSPVTPTQMSTPWIYNAIILTTELEISEKSASVTFYVVFNGWLGIRARWRLRVTIGILRECGSCSHNY